MQSDPKVSVIISAYGAEDYIEECISSVASQLYFQENNFEILVGIDGCCSTLDKMMKIKDRFKSLKVYYFPNNSGPYLVFNTLINHSQAQIISIFGADDIMEKNFMSNNIELLDSSNFVIAQCANFSHPNKEEVLRIYNPDGVILFNKNHFLKIKGFENWRCGADSDLKVRLQLYGLSLVYSKEVTFLRRIHPKSLTASSKFGIKSEYRKTRQEIVRSRKKFKISKFEISDNYQLI
jgi:glycosyltransferase involved in cell wall biosynthesis